MNRLVSCLLLLLHWALLVLAVPNCCDEGHFLNGKKRCDNNKNISLTCELRYALNKTNDFAVLSIDDAQNLVMDNQDYVAPDSYCFGTTKLGRELYIICYDPETFQETKRIIISVFQLISVFFFIWTIAVYAVLPEMMDLQGICTIQSIVGLMISYTVLVTIQLSGYLNPVECHLVAYVMYTAFLYAFFWLNILCFHMWKQVAKPRILEAIKNWKPFYFAYGMGGPLICLIIVATIHHWNPEQLQHIHPGIAETSCWFKSARESLIYFYAPVSVLLTMNVIFFIWTAIVLWYQMKVCQRSRILKFRWKLYLKLFFIMGISWIFEIISATVEYHRIDLKYLWMLTDTVNALQGLIIFLILVFCRKRVIRSLANKKVFLKLHLPSTWKYQRDSECEDMVEETEIPMNSS